MRKQERPPIPPSPAVLDRAARAIQFEGSEASGGSEFAQLRQLAIGRKDAASSARRERRRMTSIIYGEQNEMKAIRAFQRWLRQIERKKPLRRFVVKVSLTDRRPVTRKEKRVTPTVGGKQLPAYKGTILDRRSRQGVFVSIEYDGAKRHAFGVARRRVLYDVNPEHCEKDVRGRAMFFSNMGRDELEIATAADVIETTQRATRANAKIGVNLIVQLPHDISQEARLEIMRRITQGLFAQHGLPFVASLHEPSADGDQRNHHGHIWAAWRAVERTAPYQWKISEDFRSDLDGNDYWRHARRVIAETITVVARSQGLDRTYTHLSNAERGLVHKPQKKLGKVKTEQSRRGELVADNIANEYTIAASEQAEAKLQAVREKRARNRRESLRRVQNTIAQELTPSPAVIRAPSTATVSPPQISSVTAPKPVALVPRRMFSPTGVVPVVPKPVAVPMISDTYKSAAIVLAPKAKGQGPIAILPFVQPVRRATSIDILPKLAPVLRGAGVDIKTIAVTPVPKLFSTNVRPVPVAARSNLGPSAKVSGVASISVQRQAHPVSPVRSVQVADADRGQTAASLKIAVRPSIQAKVIALDLPTFSDFQMPRVVAPVAPFDASTTLPIPAVRIHSRMEIKPVEAAPLQDRLRPQMVLAVVSPVTVQPVRGAAHVGAVTLPAAADLAIHPVAPISNTTRLPLNVRPVSPVGRNQGALRRELATVTAVKPVGRQISSIVAPPQNSAVTRLKLHKVREIAPIAAAFQTIRPVGTVNSARLSTGKAVKVMRRSTIVDATSLNIFKPVMPVKPMSAKLIPALSPIRPAAVTLPRPVAVVAPGNGMGEPARLTQVQAAVGSDALSTSPVSRTVGSQKPLALPALVKPMVAKQALTNVATVTVATPLATKVSEIEPLAVVRPTVGQGRMMPVAPVRSPKQFKPATMVPVSVKPGRDGGADKLFRLTHAAMVRLAAEVDRKKAELARKAALMAPDLPTYAQICFAEAVKRPLDYRIDRFAAGMGRSRCELVMTQDRVIEPKVAHIESWGLTRRDIASPPCQKLLLRQYIHQQIEADQLELELGRQVQTSNEAFAANLLDRAKLSPRARATADIHYRDGLFAALRLRIVERSFRGKHVPTREDELRARGVLVDGLSPWLPPRDPGAPPLYRPGMAIDGPSL